ncbi:hypothetical protein GCM10008957_55420 [Deinococcus ruber]|uniref:HTH marR-type domain-containing protein n=1 Tax=Deinococcus ruber TaxID=1848197 RepID=A0A918FIB4_9DEIO|nr:hypothetical protein GCM10008957_55420 [Deinococcus ruber]
MDGHEQFVERAGVFLEMLGMPRVAGRTLGALLTAPADGMTAAELAATLHASRAGISTAVNHLTLMGLAERAPKRGERADRFRMRPNAWAVLTEQGNRKLETLHALALEGLNVLPEGADPGPLREMKGFYELWLRLFPGLLDEWHRLQAEEARQP